MIPHSDDDVQFTGTLVDHFYIDIRMGQRRKNPPGCTSGGTHPPAHHGNQGKIGFQFQEIRLYCPMDPCNDLLFLFLKLILMDKDGKSIDS